VVRSLGGQATDAAISSGLPISPSGISDTAVCLASGSFITKSGGLHLELDAALAGAVVAKPGQR
jgi:hypothetical protein